ncbi:hypothetical protein MEX01_08340 [Methylorubrum extorquens]|nr:hypothetical protein MEX01_08340 [Methylorubrum extorquens]
MIVGGRLGAHLQGEDFHWVSHAGRAAPEQGKAIDLCCRHPEPSGGIDPHRVDLEQARVLDQARDGAVRRDPEDASRVRVADEEGSVDGVTATRSTAPERVSGAVPGASRSRVGTRESGPEQG